MAEENRDRPNMADLFAAAVPSARQNPLLVKATHSLGWRNRYSQSDKYPVEIFARASSASASAPLQRLRFAVRQVQARETTGTYGTGATVWPASMVLLKFLERSVAKDPSMLRNKSVIDLGAGTCVTSIAAALLGAGLVVCTDGNDHVVSLAEGIVDEACQDLRTSVPSPVQKSKKKMIGDCELRVRKFFWGKHDELMLEELRATVASTMKAEKDCIAGRQYYDIILISDCVLPKLYPIEPLLRAISNLSGPETICYVSYEHRHFPEYDPRERFGALCEMNGLTMRLIPSENHHPKYSVDDIEIWEVRKKKPE